MADHGHHGGIHRRRLDLAATGQDVQAAADSAARAASLQPHPSSAPAAAEESAQAALAAAGRACSDQSVTVDDSHFTHGGHVEVIVECEVELRLAGLELPGAVTFEAAARAPIETFRELGDRP